MLFFSLFSISLALWLVYPRAVATEHLASGRTKAVDLPWVFWEVSNGNQLSVHLPVHGVTPRRFNITPDDRLTALSVNGQSVPLGGIPDSSLTDWRHGFEIDLSPWLHNGDNTIDFTVDNYLLGGGIVLHPLPGWQRLLLAAGLLPWLLLLRRWFALSRPQLLVLSAAVLVLSFYWAATPWTLHNYDVMHQNDSGHYGYIRYVLAHLSLPRPDQGWEYYQPPLYYMVAALACRWAEWFGLAEAETLQALALLFWLVFLAASAATLRLALRRSPQGIVLATAALALWPSGVIHAIRIGNEPAFYAGAAVATWFMFRWWRGNKRRHLAGMALSIAAALLCKATAGVLAVAAVLLIALRVVRRGGRPRAVADAAIAAVILAGGAVLSAARGLYYWSRNEISDVLIGNIGGLAQDTGLHVSNRFRDYIPLDLPVFLTSPWVDSRDDATGRNNYWNFFLRSSLSAEFSFDGAMQRVIALAWGGILLLLLLSLAARLSELRYPLRAFWRDLPWPLLALLWLVSSLSVRINYPFSSCSDFRFVLPLLLPFLIACARGRRLPQLLLLGLSLSSAVFFLGL